jgi:anaerobic magnesium-protoporphyrin IX monomethyl ester cyclase
VQDLRLHDVAGSGGHPQLNSPHEVCALSESSRRRFKVVLYNPQAVFFTMPLALLAIGSELDPEIYEVVTIDARLDPNAESTLLSHIGEALCLGVTVLTGAPISDALRISRAAKLSRPDLCVVWGWT